MRSQLERALSVVVAVAAANGAPAYGHNTTGWLGVVVAVVRGVVAVGKGRSGRQRIHVSLSG